MSDGSRRTLTVLAAVGLMIGLMVHSWSWMAPAVWVDAGMRFFLWDEGSGTELQVKLAFVGAMLAAAPIYLLLLRLPWLRTRSATDAASPSLDIPGYLWLGLGAALITALVWLPLPGPPDRSGERLDALLLDWAGLWLLSVLLPTWMAVVLFAVGVGSESARGGAGRQIALPTSALVVYLSLTMGLFTFFWGATLHLAPITHRVQVRVLAIETIRKPHKAGVLHWNFAEVSPWAGLEGPQWLQILDPHRMDRLMIDQSIELGWASVWNVPVIKTIEAVDEPMR